MKEQDHKHKCLNKLLQIINFLNNLKVKIQNISKSLYWLKVTKQIKILTKFIKVNLNNYNMFK